MSGQGPDRVSRAAADPDRGVPARAAALTVLRQVLRHHRSLDEVLETDGEVAALPGRDRAFVRLLAATVLRRHGQLDELLTRYLERPQTVDAEAIEILRLGAAQLLFLGTPPHAAVDTAVDLARRQAPRFRGLVNAVLRRLADQGRDLEAAQDAARQNTPDWLWRSWSAAYGVDTARRIAEAHLVEPPLDFTVKGDPAAWADQLGGVVLPTGTVRRAMGGSIADLPGYAEGEWWVQDAAAALPVRLLGDVAGRTVFDLCAAPGGKTAQLAAAGARVIAVEQSATRAERLRTNLDRLGLTAELVVADASAWTPPEPADAVLLDAPCSATGSIRRHPDIARLKRPAEVAKLTLVQERLLAKAATLVRPGGLIVYATCSLQREEGEERIAGLLGRTPDLQRVPVAPAELAGLAPLVTAAGEVRTLPGVHLSDQGGLDGFFIARLRRRE